MPAKRTVRSQLLRSQVTVILLLAAAIMAATFVGASRAVQTLSRSVIDRAVEQTAAQLRSLFEPVQDGLLTARGWGQEGLVRPDMSPAEFNRLFLPLVAHRPQIGSIALGNLEGRGILLFRTASGWQNLLVDLASWGARARVLGSFGAGEAGSGETWVDLGSDPRELPWFRGAIERGNTGGAAPEDLVVWTERFQFLGQGEPGITASVHYASPDGSDHVLACDVRLREIFEFVRGLEVSSGGGVAILTEEGRLLALSDRPLFGVKRTLEDIFLRTPRELGVPLVDAAVSAFVARQGGAGSPPVRFESGGEVWWGQVRAVPLGVDHDLIVAVLVPSADILDEREQIRWWILGITLVALSIAVGRAALLARDFSRPIEAMVERSDRISRGDLDPEPPVESELAEIDRLALAQERMRAELKTLLKLERDIQIARQIQQNTFPRRLPRLPGIDVAASSEPADETGGDTYDVIGYRREGGAWRLASSDPEGLILLLADATGHGVGAALSVAQVRAMLRMGVRAGEELSEVAAHINEQLREDLPENRFVTAWLGRVPAGGALLHSFSAGQGPLMHVRASNGRVEMHRADAPPLGLVAELPVDGGRTVALAPGDVWAVLSDGFLEARNADGEELGAERAAETLRRHRRESCREILEHLRREVAAFGAGAGADDDRTAVIVKRKSP